MAETTAARRANLRSRIAGHKGHFGRKEKVLKGFLPLVQGNPKKANCAALEEDLMKLQHHYEKMLGLYEALREITEEEAALVEIESRLEELEGRFQDLRVPCMMLFGNVRESTPVEPTGQEAVVRPKTRARVNEALKPDRLSLDFTPAEMRSWFDKFRAFYDTSELQNYAVRDQHAFLFTCVNTQLEVRLREQIDDHTPIFQDNGCLDRIREEFSLKYPLFTRRMEFFKYNQESSQSFRDYDTQLQRKGNEADLQNLRVDELYMFRFMTGTNDARLREKFLKIEDPTLEKMRQVANMHEVQQQSLSAIAGENSAHHVQRQGGGPRPQGGQGGGPQKVTCFRCGEMDHKSNTCSMSMDVKCKKCSNVGHLEKACIVREKFFKSMKQSRDKRQNDDAAKMAAKVKQILAEENRVNAASTVNVVYMAKNTPTPTFIGTFETLHSAAKYKRCFSAEVIPDTGATRTIISGSLARKNKLALKECNERLRAANGEFMDVSGAVTLLAGFQGMTATVEAIVSEDLTAEVLMSWHDIMNLGIISQNFPKVVEARTATSFKSECKALEKEMLHMFPDVFSDRLGRRRMKGPDMHIHLDTKKEITPKRVLTARQVPIHLRDKATELVDQLIEDGILAKVSEPTEWISPAHFVPKPNGGVRMVSDFVKLNQYVKRPVHPFPSTRDILQNLDPRSTVFAKMDAVSGYFQIPLDEESSYLTTMLIPIYGKVRYLVAPMGLNASSDEWNERSDVPFAGHKGTQKLVDDGLTEAENLPQLRERLIALLKDCEKHKITLSKKKFQIGSEVKFAGHLVGAEGVKPDPEKVKAITEFPTPTDLTSLRSFLGLANQLGAFLPDLAQACEPMRQLLKKETAYIWGEDQEHAFSTVKRLLASKAVVKPFDPNLKTELFTDASRINGLGFILLQREKNGISHRMIRCGSRSLQPAEKRYATIELECLGILYAVQQCQFFLHGIPDFQVITDHRPLLGIFQKDLHELQNARLLRFRERLQMFPFELIWLAGKRHCMADALSRAPVFQPDEDEGEAEGATILGVSASEDMHLQVILRAKDEKYEEVMQAVREGKEMDELRDTHAAKEYAKVWDELSIYKAGAGDILVLDGHRIVVPKDARKSILESMHRGHCGMLKTIQLARASVYWPGIINSIKQCVRKCDVCARRLPSQADQKTWAGIREGLEATNPMSDVAVDIFTLQGSNYLVMVDRYSGFPFCKPLRATHTGAVTGILTAWFVEWGFPQRIRTDGGPQFRGEFKEYCQRYAIEHELASPHHPEANGLAESAVKNTKFLLEKCKASKEDFSLALLEWRNTPNAAGVIPAVLFCGRRQKTQMPLLSDAYKVCGEKARREMESKRRELSAQHNAEHDKHTRELRTLKAGEKVRVQDPVTKLWEKRGEVLGVRENGHSYVVDIEGREFLRNRRFLRPLTEAGEEEEDEHEKPTWAHIVQRNLPVRPRTKSPTSGDPCTRRREDSTSSSSTSPPSTLGWEPSSSGPCAAWASMPSTGSAGDGGETNSGSGETQCGGNTMWSVCLGAMGSLGGHTGPTATRHGGTDASCNRPLGSSDTKRSSDEKLSEKRKMFFRPGGSRK